MAHAADHDFEQTVKADPRGSVRVSNVAGKVHVIGWDRPEVEVKARFSGNVERVEVLSDKGRTTIKVILPRSSMRSGEADLADSGAQAERSRHLGRERGCVAPSACSARSDSRRSAAMSGPSLRRTSKARPSAAICDSRASPSRATCASRRSAAMCTSIAAVADVEVTSVSGDLLLDVSSVTTVRTRTTSGDLSLRGALARDGSVEAETISGDVTVRVKPVAGFQYEATSFSGTIGNCFGRHAENTSAHGPGTRLNGTAGDGRGRVRVKSMSGDVAICDR